MKGRVRQLPDLGRTSRDTGPTRSGAVSGQMPQPAPPPAGPLMPWLLSPQAQRWGGPEQPPPREASVFTPFPGEQTEAQRGETCPSSSEQQRPDCGPSCSPSWRCPGARSSFKTPSLLWSPSGGNAADGLGIFSCLSPDPAHHPRASGNKGTTGLSFPAPGKDSGLERAQRLSAVM